VRRLAFVIGSVLSVFAPTLAEAQQRFVAALRSAQEVPANPSTAMGTCMVTLNAAETTVSTACSYAGLGSALVAGHIHGISGVGVNAPIIIDLGPPTGATSGTFSAGPSAITPTQVAALRSNTLYINLHSSNFPGGEIRGQLKSTKTIFDRDGDSRTDLEVFRGSTATFWTQRSLDGGITAEVFGQTSGENFFQVVAGEWDGDGIADYMLISVNANLSFNWTVLQSATGTTRIVNWGGGTGLNDTLAPADYDGDGILDPAVFRRSTGTWFILQSSTGTARVESFGALNDFPSIGDYDGDGRADLTVVRSDGVNRIWWTLRSSDGQITVTHWGTAATDGVFFFAPIDIDGDGKQDIMVNRTVSGQRMFIVLRSSDSAALYLPWGLSTDAPLFGDYDGDGRTDFVARRNVSGQLVWFIYQSSNGQPRYAYWGIAGDQ